MTHPDEAKTILDRLNQLLTIVSSHDPTERGESLTSALGRHLGFPATDAAVVEASFAAHRYVDYDVALALAAERDPGHQIADLANEHSVLRGQVLVFESSGFEPSESGITFLPRPEVTGDQVILPPGVLDRVRLHVLGIAQHREALRAQRQHLKRGVLLYGPPGSGKTHTVRHLITESPGQTVILLSGETLRFIGVAASLARSLQPGIVVLEDCDLVAESRDFMPGFMKPLLFEVLDAMDGLDADADVTFLLTTNGSRPWSRRSPSAPGASTSPPRSRCRTPRVAAGSSGSTPRPPTPSGTPPSQRRSGPPRAPRPRSRRSWCAAPSSRRRWRGSRPATRTCPRPSRS